jgi:hypothetical protein
MKAVVVYHAPDSIGWLLLKTERSWQRWAHPTVPLLAIVALGSVSVPCQ